RWKPSKSHLHTRVSVHLVWQLIHSICIYWAAPARRSRLLPISQPSCEDPPTQLQRCTAFRLLDSPWQQMDDIARLCGRLMRRDVTARIERFGHYWSEPSRCRPDFTWICSIISPMKQPTRKPARWL